MAIRNIIEAIVDKHKNSGIDIGDPVTSFDISFFEERFGFSLPVDFIEFYISCDGFSCIEDIFNMIALSEIGRHAKDYGTDWFYFSEYMIYSDMWGLRLTKTGA